MEQPDVKPPTEARELIISCAGLVFVALLLCRFENLSQQLCAEILPSAPVIMLLRHVFYRLKKGTQLTSIAGRTMEGRANGTHPHC